MAKRPSSEWDRITEHAQALAHHGHEPPDTGHYLSALVELPGAPRELLLGHGVRPERLDGARQRVRNESARGLAELRRLALALARERGREEPEGLHLLASLARVGHCRAHGLLVDMNVDPDLLAAAALRLSDAAADQRTRQAPPAATAAARPTTSRPAQLPLSIAGRGTLTRDLGRSLERRQRESAQRRSARNAASPTGQPAGTGPDLTSPTAASSGFALDAARFPLLTTLGRNLTELASTDALQPIVGRQNEMERIADVLNRRQASSPCLVGPSGVGKTALVEGLAWRVAHGQSPELKDRIVVELRPTSLLAGTSYRGALAERIGTLREEVARAEGRVILFLDELGALFASSDGAEAVQELKLALGRGELNCIAAMSEADWTRRVESDPTLARRFTRVEVGEPSTEETLAIVTALAPGYARHHGVTYTPAALEAAVRLAGRYLQDRAFPDKALGLIDLAGSRARRAKTTELGAAAVAAVVAAGLGIPVERLAASERERLLHLEDELAERVVGHRPVLAALGETLRRNAAGFHSGRPIGSFLFLGPTGVGKTETAKALARLLFPDPGALVRLDLSEFSESHAVARLIGAPPGYLGHDDGGQLSEAVRRRPYCVLLLDEIEKAHRDVLQLFLQVLDDGRLTDGRGRTVSFANTLIIMTSNLGSDLRETPSARRVGFGQAGRSEPERPAFAAHVIEAARAHLPAELWNRIDEPLVFAPLTLAEVARIAELQVAEIAAGLMRESEVGIRLGEGAIATLCNQGYDLTLGARPMRRAVQRLVEGPVARLVLSGEAPRQATILVAGDGRELTFTVDPPPGE